MFIFFREKQISNFHLMVGTNFFGTPYRYTHGKRCVPLSRLFWPLVYDWMTHLYQVKLKTWMKKYCLTINNNLNYFQLTWFIDHPWNITIHLQNTWENHVFLVPISSMFTTYSLLQFYHFWESQTGKNMNGRIGQIMNIKCIICDQFI